MADKYFVDTLKNEYSITVTNEILYKNNNCIVSYIFTRDKVDKFSFTLKRDLVHQSLWNAAESEKFDQMTVQQQRDYLSIFKWTQTWSAVTDFTCVYDDIYEKGWLLHLTRNKARQDSLPQWSVFPENIKKEIGRDLLQYFNVVLK